MERKNQAGFPSASRCRALGLAGVALGDPAATEMLAREINLAAALHRLGDRDGKAKAILGAYAEDPRGFCANYARRILQKKCIPAM